MKKWYTYIIMLAAVLFASCNVMEDPLHSDGECETEPVNVRLILSMMGGRGLSRAPLTDTPTSESYLPNEEPLGNEYYINPYDVEVLVFTCGETPAASTFVERASMVRASETEYYYQYQLDGTLTKIQEGTAYRIVVLANLNGSCYSTGAIALTEGSTTMQTYLESLKYTGYSASFTTALLAKGSTERIPMWGTTAAYLNDGATITLNMLRAMSKVKVKMAKSVGTLSGVTLEYANPGGYVTPLIANVDETTATNANGVSAITANNAVAKTITGGNTQRVRTPRIPTGLDPIDGLAEGSTLLFSDVSSTDNYEYVIYIPEYKNIASNGTAPYNALITAASMKLTVGSGENAKDYKLEFKDYAETNPTGYFDIIRNYFYDYTITAVEDNSGMEFTLSVQNWDDVNVTVPFSSIISYTVNGWNRKDHDYLAGNEYYITKNGTAEFLFRIDNPLNCTYTVELTDNINFSYSKDTYTDDDNTVWQRIIIKPKNDDTQKYATTMKVFAIRSDNGKSVELDVTKTGEVETSSGDINHYIIKQEWTD